MFNTVEDCIASGTGRKMIMVFVGTNNVIRRCFADWRAMGRARFGVEASGPWGDAIQIYNASYNTIENSISYGRLPYWSISIQANTYSINAVGNKVLGSMAIRGGIKPDGTLMYWGNGQVQPTLADRPQPTSCTGITDLGNPDKRSGFVLYGSGLLRDNLFQDIFAWGNATLGLTFLGGGVPLNPNNVNNYVRHATILNNGLDEPVGPWPGQFGGINTDVLQRELNEFDAVEDSYIQTVFVNWPNYPNPPRNTHTMTGAARGSAIAMWTAS